jgi:hypothetical protein
MRSDLEDAADLREVGLDVELLDPILEDRSDLFGSEFQVVSFERERGFRSRGTRARKSLKALASRALP